VSYLPPGDSGRPAYLGHLFVEPRRHAPGLADLTDAEARAVGWWCTQASRALRQVAGAEHVYAMVIGDAVPHLHVHLQARYPGAPREYWWDKVAQWPCRERWAGRPPAGSGGQPGSQTVPGSAPAMPSPPGSAIIADRYTRYGRVFDPRSRTAYWAAV